jgi:hypothetical protein
MVIFFTQYLAGGDFIMAMYKEDRFKAALEMIRVTPENHTNLTPAMILHVYEVIAAAEKQIKEQEKS